MTIDREQMEAILDACEEKANRLFGQAERYKGNYQTLEPERQGLRERADMLHELCCDLRDLLSEAGAFELTAS